MDGTMYDPNLINGAMPVPQAQVPPNFQQAPVPQNFAQGYTPIGQLDAAAITGMNQVRANAINAANAPKSPWAQGQDISNNIFGNVIAPFAAGMGAPGAMDAAKTFKDQIESDRKTRSDMLKSNIDQIKDITSTFDNLNRTQVAELGRETANTRALQALQESANRKAAAEARLKEIEHLHQLQEEHWKRMDANNGKNADTRAATGAAVVAEKNALTPAKAALMGQTATLRGAQAKALPQDTKSKIDYRAAMGQSSKQRADNGTTNATERGRHNQVTEGIQARNAATGEKKAATQEQVAQYKQEHPTGAGAVAAALSAALKGPPKTAQGASQAGPPQAGPKHLDQATAMQFLQQAGGDKEKAREMARKAGHSF